MLALHTGKQLYLPRSLSFHQSPYQLTPFYLCLDFNAGHSLFYSSLPAYPISSTTIMIKENSKDINELLTEDGFFNKKWFSAQQIRALKGWTTKDFYPYEQKVELREKRKSDG